MIFDMKKEQHFASFYDENNKIFIVIDSFDNKEFNSLSVCTFVSSIKYFFNKVNDFDKIELLLGIEDGENAQNCRYFSSKI